MQAHTQFTVFTICHGSEAYTRTIIEMDVSDNIPQIQSSPTSFHTVEEFQSPSSFPSYSEFEGFSDKDNWPPQSPTYDTAPAPARKDSFIPPPTCDIFPTLEDALLSCQSWARDHSYAIRKNRNKTRRKTNTIYKVYIKYEYAGKK
jgi:hypothetical protein